MLLAAAACALFPTPTVAQGVPRALERLDEANGQRWVAPLTRALAPALTAGFFTTGGRGEGFGLSVRVNAGLVPTGDERFTPVLPGTIDFDGTTWEEPYVVAGAAAREGSPTVAGGGEGLRLTPRPGSRFEEALDAAGVSEIRRDLPLPDGLGLRRVPVPVLEARLALRGVGMSFVGRFAPTVELFDELGDVTALGGGVLLTISRFLPFRGIDLGVSAVTQKLDAAGWLDASASAFGVVASRQLGPVRPYVHAALASATVDVRYHVRNPEEALLLPPDGAEIHIRHHESSEPRVALGATLKLPVLDVAAEYVASERNAVSLRVTLLGT